RNVLLSSNEVDIRPVNYLRLRHPFHGHRQNIADDQQRVSRLGTHTHSKGPLFPGVGDLVLSNIFRQMGRIFPSLYCEVPSRSCSSTYPVFSVFNHNLAPRRRMSTIAARLASETSAAYGHVASNNPRGES